MKTRKQLAILAALGTVTLAACGSKTDANEKNFGAALTQYFDKKGDKADSAPAYELAFLFFENGVSQRLFIDASAALPSCFAFAALTIIAVGD